MSCVEDISMLVHLDANSKLYLRRIPVLRHVLIHLQMFCFRTQCIKSKTFEKCLKPHCRIRPFHESFTETDAIGCEAQLNRKVPPNEKNFSWARFSLLRTCKMGTANWAPAQFAGPRFRICSKYILNSPVEVATPIFISSWNRSISKENVNRSGENILEIWNVVYFSRTSIGVEEELRSTSPGFPGVY